MAETEYAGSVSFLLSQLGAHVAGRFAEMIAELGMSPREFGVLSNLAQLGPRTQQQLADELGMHRNNMVALIDSLEAVKWARRVRSTEDRRAFTIELTASGRRVIARALRVVPALDAELTATLTVEQRGQLGRLLVALAGGAALAAGVHPHLAGRRPTA